MEEIMIQTVLLILYLAIGFAIISGLAAFDVEISEFVFIVTVLLWPLLIVFGIIALIMYLFIMAGNKIGEFLRRKFDEK
jgi:hypothetical protein